jgi:hypothetical protein
VVKKVIGFNSTIRTYASISEAGRHTGVSRNAITTVCHAGGGEVGDFNMRFDSDGEDEEEVDDKDEVKTQHAKLERSDVSTLLPLTRTPPSNKNYKIELICKLTGDVHACFPNVEYAAQSLDSTRKTIRQACRAFGNTEMSHVFATCDLRFAVR